MSKNSYIQYILDHSFIRILIAMILLVFITTGLIKADNPGPLFQSDKIIKLELKSDFTSIEKGRNEDPEYFDGELIYYSDNQKPDRFSVKVMSRGHFRRNPEICSFPPLLVNFKEKEVNNTLFDGQDKLKLVTPCQDEEYVIEEYLVYKMYNLVTELSLKVRLAKIVYFDTGSGKELFEKYSFFIEDKDDMAKRNDAEAKDRFLTPFDLNKENFEKMAMFEYLIGNQDWYITSRKNVIILEPEDSSHGLMAVPYDFDLSGLIDVSYSKPEGVPEYALADKRVYKGLCYTDNEFHNTFEYFRKLKPKFEALIDNQELIPKYTRKKIIKYLNDFYTVIENDKLVRREFLSVCQTKKDYNLSDLKVQVP